MTYKTFDTVDEQRKGLEAVAKNLEGFWRELAERACGGIDLSVAVRSDADTLRQIASKLGG